MGLGTPIALWLAATPLAATLFRAAVPSSDARATIAVGYWVFMFILLLDVWFGLGFDAIGNPLFFFVSLLLAGVLAGVILGLAVLWSAPSFARLSK